MIAETAAGDADHVVVVGAHLDSVADGPGINDNGSGSRDDPRDRRDQMAEPKVKPRNKLRFAFWGAEESGLLGSEHYVDEPDRGGARQDHG